MHPPRPSGRFPASARVKKREEFRAIQARGRKVVTRGFVFLLHAQPSGPELPPRLGITASRKIGNAPTRNRAKRLVREAFRAARPLFRPGLDVVVIVRHLDASTRLRDVLLEWQRAFAAISRESARALCPRTEPEVLN